jgi:D-beta-D-heptose 7-phosphate kinase/D-beta-D-heptose 1-phosphate adenosyltransferase
MESKADIFGPGSNVGRRLINDHDRLLDIVKSLQQIGEKVILVLGTFDLTHIGHARYLELAKNHGGIVIVGIDPDEAVKLRKGPRRPLVPLDERLEMLIHLRHVDIVTVTTDYDDHGITGYELIKKIQPDIFVISEMNDYTPEQIEEIKKYSKELVVIPQQAETTTSAKLRLMNLQMVEEAKKRLEELIHF